MTTRPAVIQATYHTFRHVQGRKALQLVFEVPEEQTGHVLAILGSPKHDSAKWFAIAALDPSVAASTDSPPQGSTPSAGPSSPPSRSAEQVKGDAGKREAEEGIRRRFTELPRSQQAALKLEDQDFLDWLVATHWAGQTESYDGDALLKAVLGIASKRDLDRTDAAADAWDRLYTSYTVRAYQR